MASPSDSDFRSAAILRQALRAFARRSDELTRENGLTPEQYELLLLLYVTPAEKATIGQLCHQLRRGQSAVTQLARRAENAGLITRRLSRSDARIRYLRLTRRGEQRLDATVSALTEERTQLTELIGSLDR